MANRLRAIWAAFRAIARTKTFRYSLLIGLTAAWGFALVLEPTPQALVHLTKLDWCTLSADRCLAALCVDSNRIQVWETASGQLLATLHVPDGLAHCRSTFSRDKQMFAFLSTTGTVAIWDVPIGRLRETYVRQEWARNCTLTGLAFDNSGRLVLGTRREDEIVLWDVAGQRVFKGIPLPETPSWRFDIGGDLWHGIDGCLVMWADGKNMKIWDLATGKLRVHLPNQTEFQWAVISADDKTLVTREDRACKIIDTATGRERTLVFAGQVWDISPDGKIAAWCEPSSEDTSSSILKWLRELPHRKNQRPVPLVHFTELATGKEIATIRRDLLLFGGNQTIVAVESDWTPDGTVGIYPFPLPSCWPRIIAYASLMALVPVLVGLFVTWRGLASGKSMRRKQPPQHWGQ